jgi:hypothetical protein
MFHELVWRDREDGQIKSNCELSIQEFRDWEIHLRLITENKKDDWFGYLP